MTHTLSNKTFSAWLSVAEATATKQSADPAPQGPRKRLTCAELGICQGYTPRCNLCDGHAEAHDIDSPEEAGREDYVWSEIAYWGAVAATSVLTVGFAFGVAGYVYIRFFQ
jgi:hypothetical protein